MRQQTVFAPKKRLAGGAGEGPGLQWVAMVRNPINLGGHAGMGYALRT